MRRVPKKIAGALVRDSWAPASGSMEKLADGGIRGWLFPYRSFSPRMGSKKKGLFFGAMLLAGAISFPVPAMPEAAVQNGFPLPPPIVVAAPPEVVLLPNTGVYVAPDLSVDLFFFDGWWWRPWEGSWYRSRNYHSGGVEFCPVKQAFNRLLVFSARFLAKSLPSSPSSPFFLQNKTERHDRPAHVFLRVMVL